MSDLDSDTTVDSEELEQIIASVKKKEKPAGCRKNEIKGNRHMKRQIHSEKLHEVSESDSEDDCKQPNIPKPDSSADVRPLCKYGINCYRKNPEHVRMFQHVQNMDPEVGASSSKSKSESIGIKKAKIESRYSDGKPLPRKGNIYGFYFTRVCGIAKEYNDYVSLHIKELLSTSRGKLKASAQFNYMFDIPWLMEQYPAKFRQCPLSIVHGEQKESKQELEKFGEAYPQIKFCQAKLPIPYGTHHTKMMILLYEEGLRVIIHTSNLVENDWFQKTQAMWISPLFPKLTDSSPNQGESKTRFKADLIEYISSYGCKELAEWIGIIQKHDLSKAQVVLIASVPGRHLGSKKTTFGHLKLRKVLNLNGPTKDLVSSGWPVVGQFSSIGSLGPSPENWLTSEWLYSLSTVKNDLSTAAPLKLVYPSVENVRNSLEGYPAGASLPYSINVATKQEYLKNFLHQWKSERNGRSEASPHIKTYVRLSPDSRKLAWFLVTSANLSKAAWGSLEKNGTQLMVRSYELGVLFLPQNFNSDEYFSICGKISTSEGFPIAFDVPLSKYQSGDEPWIWDIPHVNAPDRHGNKWCPTPLK